MSSKNVQSWYENSLTPHERKMRGHFSTPPLLVERILDACGYAPSHDLSGLRVLDPACGSGNFLVGAAQRIVVAGMQRQLAPKAIFAQMQRNLWGFDPDPVACFLAEMELRAVTNMLYSNAVPALHIHQADGLSLPWQQCANVDLFLANPPYLATKNTDLYAYRSIWQHGQTDSYLLFLELALQIVRPGGWIALVLPDALLARTNAAKERQHLLTQTTIHHLWHFAHLFAAHVGAVVVIAQKCPPSSTHQVLWKRERWQPETVMAEPQQQVTQYLLQAQPQAQMRYLLGRYDQQSLVVALHTCMYGKATVKQQEERIFAPLRDFVHIQRGEELGKSSVYLHSVTPSETGVYYPVLRGGSDVRPYAAPLGRYWIAHEHVAKPLAHYLAPKLLVVKSTPYLQAALDLYGQVALQTLYLLTPHTHSEMELDDLYFLLALLNARVLREYVYTLYTAYKWVQPQIEQHVLASLPVPLYRAEAEAERLAIIERAKLLCEACSIPLPVVELKQRTEKLLTEQELAIANLYRSAFLAIDKGVIFYG